MFARVLNTFLIKDRPVKTTIDSDRLCESKNAIYIVGFRSTGKYRKSRGAVWLQFCGLIVTAFADIMHLVVRAVFKKKLIYSTGRLN